MKNQILPQRFIDATSKLYNAFHNGTLNAMDCQACAVGNLCNNDSTWSDVFCGGSLKLRPTKKGLKLISSTGYSVEELIHVEQFFMFGRYKGREYGRWGVSSDNQFKGLCAVIEYLCELDGIPNIMDYTSLFETENEKPKRELIEVFR